jgi:hypothetical protein
LSVYPVKGGSISVAKVSSVSECAIEKIVAEGEEVVGGGDVDMIGDEDFKVAYEEVP